MKLTVTNLYYINTGRLPFRRPTLPNRDSVSESVLDDITETVGDLHDTKVYQNKQDKCVYVQKEGELLVCV